MKIQLVGCTLRVGLSLRVRGCLLRSTKFGFRLFSRVSRVGMETGPPPKCTLALHPLQGAELKGGKDFHHKDRLLDVAGD